MDYKFIIKFEDFFTVGGVNKNHTRYRIPYRSLEAFKIEIPFRIGERKFQNTDIRSRISSVGIADASITEELHAFIKSVNRGADFGIYSLDFIPRMEPDPVEHTPIHFMFGGADYEDRH